jgi:PAS domain S-box-containing protein
MTRENRFASQSHIWGLVVSLILLVAVTAASFLAYQEYVQVAEETRSLNSFLDNTRGVVGEFLDAEANERSFLLTRIDRYREAYARAVSRLHILEASPVLVDQHLQYRVLFDQLRREIHSQLRSMDQDLLLCQATNKDQLCNNLPAVRANVQAGDRVFAFRDAVLHRGSVDLSKSRDQTRTRARFCGIIATTGCAGIFVLVFVSAHRIKKLLQRQADLNERLANYAEELQNVADSVPQVLWRMNSDGAIEYANHRWIDTMGCASDEYAFTWTTLVHPDDQSKIKELFCSDRADRTFVTAECRLRHANLAVYRWFLIRALAVDNRSVQKRQWYGTFTDIHDQKQAEEALKRANQELKQFAYIAAHDLQEPVRNIANLSGLVLKVHRDQLAPNAILWLEESAKNSHRMVAMVKDLLAFSTALDDASIAMTTANAELCLAGALTSLQATVSEKGAEITHNSLPAVHIGARHLIQVFENLIENALKYQTPEVVPRIRVEAKKKGHEYVFSVSDNGIGFDPAYAERIFRIFKRLHAQHEFPGNGIGLAVCARIVNHFGGRIWAESHSNQGSTFFFTLRAAEEQLETEPRAAATRM